MENTYLKCSVNNVLPKWNSRVNLLKNCLLHPESIQKVIIVLKKIKLRSSKALSLVLFYYARGERIALVLGHKRCQ